MTWQRLRLDWLVTEERTAIDPTEIATDAVFHYSIPALDEFGDGRLEPPGEIGSGKLLLTGGEVLISKLNPRLPRVLLAETHAVPTLASTEFVALRPGPKVDERFLRYWLVSEQLRQMLSGATMSVTRSQQRIRPEILTKTWLRLPSIKEQRAIADYLDAETGRIDALIEKKQRLIELLEERNQALIDDVCVGAILYRKDGVPSGVKDIRNVRLGAISQIQTGLTVDASRANGPGAVTLPYLRVANVQAGELRLDELKNISVSEELASRCSLLPGDVLMTEGGDPDKLGRGTVWPGHIARCLHQNHIFALRPLREILLPHYLALVTRTKYARAYFEMTASKTTGIASTSTSKIASFRVPLPSPARQDEIVRSTDCAIRRLDRLHRLITRQIEMLMERRQALITATVTGAADIERMSAA